MSAAPSASFEARVRTHPPTEAAWMASASEAAAPEGAAAAGSASRPTAQPNQCLAANNNGWVCRSERASSFACVSPHVSPSHRNAPAAFDTRATFSPLSQASIYHVNHSFLATTNLDINIVEIVLGQAF